ncbi:MAG: ComF family protein [Candidatus Acidiferrales bacterium]
MSSAIGLLKYDKLARLGGWFATRLEERIRIEPEVFTADVAIPVPLHPARQRERGYNQAELICASARPKTEIASGRVPSCEDETAPSPAVAFAAGTLADGAWRIRNPKGRAS